MTPRPMADDVEKNLLLESVTAKGRGPNLDRTKIPTLDLHGCCLEAAIKKLVEFLEKHYDQKQVRNDGRLSHSLHVAGNSQMILQVVTGTGSHTNNAGGPVLKYAVNDFLQRHLFQSTYYSSGGYFVIPLRNNTGKLSYQSKTCNESTKIILTSPCTIDKTFSNHLKKSHTTGSPGIKSEHRTSVIPLMQMPTLQEVVYDEKELQRGVHESLEEYRQRQKEYSNEQKLYQQAIHVSREEINKLDVEETLILERVIQESVESSERDYDNDEEVEIAAIKQAIIESLEESEHCVDDDNGDDDVFQRVIEESKAVQDSSKHDDEDDILLRRAIEESKALHDASEHEDDDYLLQHEILESEVQKDTLEIDDVDLLQRVIIKSDTQQNVSESEADDQCQIMLKELSRLT